MSRPFLTAQTDVYFTGEAHCVIVRLLCCRASRPGRDFHCVSRYTPEQTWVRGHLSKEIGQDAPRTITSLSEAVQLDARPPGEPVGTALRYGDLHERQAVTVLGRELVADVLELVSRDARRQLGMRCRPPDEASLQVGE